MDLTTVMPFICQTGDLLSDALDEASVETVKLSDRGMSLELCMLSQKN